MSLRLGSVPTLVVSSPAAAELVLKTHDKVFASRPERQIGEYLGYGSKGMAVAKYGTYWRSGVTRRLKVLGQEFDKILETIIDDHEQEASNGNKELDELDMDETFALSLLRSTHLLAVPTSRAS
ncbi:hypothetical protein POM88_038189 [Heracleum sosnowskyi]|uniref:Cytochrome P450 n=1 Tax=Heracleum sosnowskyi TaxID=360622 RepID=A0AAD8HRJ1_9APIA|nr:hypothetical protein POM88_038189 [Heracleum sosnowskyi]